MRVKNLAPAAARLERGRGTAVLGGGIKGEGGDVTVSRHSLSSPDGQEGTCGGGRRTGVNLARICSLQPPPTRAEAEGRVPPCGKKAPRCITEGCCLLTLNEASPR